MGMMSLRRRVLEKKGGGLPYDAEIEYLQSSGTQYIDTGIYPDSSLTTVECKVSFIGNNQPCWGCRDSRGNRFWVNKDSWVEFGFGNWYSSSVKVADYTICTIFFNVLPQHQFVVNGSTPMDISLTHTWNLPICILSVNDKGNCWGKGRVYYFKILHSGSLVRDYIPVRIGTTGYLYDKVSGELFGNQGTGDFILGPDKN